MVEVGWDVDLDIGVEWSVISMIGVMFEVMFTRSLGVLIEVYRVWSVSNWMWRMSGARGYEDLDLDVVVLV